MTIYLDCNATTPIDPEVMKIVRHYMEVEFGNAGSRTHEYGLRAKQAIERAREQIAAVVNAKPDDVIFTSGATEANNLAILGLEEEGRRSKRMHIISTQIDHKAVLEPLAEMKRRGFEITLIPPNRGGWIEAEKLAAAVRADTLLVSIMHVNNETGVVQDIEAVCQQLSNHDAMLHVDAAQGFAKTGGIESPRIDMLSISGHKIHAPMGVGALIARRRGWRRLPLRPLVFGGGQERGLRAGTVPVALAASLGCASERALANRASRTIACEGFRQSFIRALSCQYDVHGDPARINPSTLNLYIKGIDSEALIIALRGIVALSTGSACTSAEHTASHVLKAMLLPDHVIAQSIRVSWAHDTPVALAAVAAEAISQSARSGAEQCG